MTTQLRTSDIIKVIFAEYPALSLSYANWD